jgi:hypothetical protein
VISDSDNFMIAVAQKDTDQLIFSAADENGETIICKTGLWPDEKLVDRLKESGAQFTAAIPTQDSPLLSFLTSWDASYIWVNSFPLMPPTTARVFSQ